MSDLLPVAQDGANGFRAIQSQPREEQPSHSRNGSPLTSRPSSDPEILETVRAHYTQETSSVQPRQSSNTIAEVEIIPEVDGERPAESLRKETQSNGTSAPLEREVQQVNGAGSGGDSNFQEEHVLRRNPTRRRTTLNLSNTSSLDKVDVADLQERLGLFTHGLVQVLPKPTRGPDGRLKLKDAVNYFIKRQRIRNGDGGLIDVPDKCATCTSLDLTTEKFLVRDRAISLKETRLFHVPYRHRPGRGNFEVGSSSRSYRLGSLKSIWRKSIFCSFCRLVIHSLTEQPNTKWLNVDAIPGTRISRERPGELEAICYASWQIDGRELNRDSSDNVKSTQARTRRIRLHWDRAGFEESYLVLVGGPTLPANDVFLGRRVATGKANKELMLNWIESCQNYHGNRCCVTRDQRFNLMVKQTYFGVIDVQEMRLTRLPPDDSYVALSYTWGNIKSPFKTTLANVRKSQKSIQDIFSKLPQTIQDAINLVKELQGRYLWVDSICIVQDSTKSWELNASAMDLVYGNAHFTICAADGDDAGAGILATTKRDFTQHMETYGPGVRLMVSYPAEAYIKKSAWNGRAWTFQERLLSKRCLIFTDSRVFFQCRSTTMREDITAEEKLGWSIEHSQAPLQMLNYLNARAILLFMKSVEIYTSRQLTRPENILAAFQGIGNVVGKKLGADMIYGLPRSHFDWALLWEPQSAADARTIEPRKEGEAQSITETPTVQGKREFPSWSWCGWKNAVIEYKQSITLGSTINLHEWLAEHTWITWYIRDGYGGLKLVWDKNSMVPKEDQSTYNRWAGYGGANQNLGITTDPYGRSTFNKRVKESSPAFVKTIPEYPFGVHISDQDDLTDTHFEDQRFLQFWTWSAYLRLGEHSPSEDSNLGENLKRYGISDYKGDWCGTIVLDSRRDREFLSRAEYQFIAISEAKEFAQDEYEGWMYYISKDREQSEWDLFYVLLIEIKDEIAYRVGLGKVYQEAFENSCREEKQWNEFILG